MLKTINQNQEEKLRKAFLSHPLLLTCQSAFHHYMASMDQFDFSSEQLFVEAADTLDEIINDPAQAPKYLTDLWDELKIDLKKRAKQTPPQNDLDTVCCVLFYVVAATLCLHWREYYNHTLVNLIYEIVENKGIINNTEQQREILEKLSKHAEGLEDWINLYEESDVWLSDEIEKCLQKKKSEKPKPIGMNLQVIKATFSYNPNNLGTTSRNTRLSEVHRLMMEAELIPLKTNLKDFLEVFSGGETLVRIPWVGYANELHYIIDQWTKRGYLPNPKEGKWVVAAARFTNRTKEKGGGLK